MQFISPFRIELQDFLSMRQASLGKSAYAHDRRYLSDFDQFAAKYTNEKSVSETLIHAWLHSRKGKSSSIANEVIVIRIFLKYLRDIGIAASLPPIPKVADDYVPYIFSDEELRRICLIVDDINVFKASRLPRLNFWI